jgi:tRNA pseudouridine38-40 synthase
VTASTLLSDLTEIFTYKVILSYKGTNYSGWQFQTVNPETIQQHVQKVIADIVNYQDFKVIGASRTDTGVHASGQVLKIVLPKKIDPKKLTLGMNSKLPNDIKVINSQFITNSFNVNRDTKSKEYHYYFASRSNQNALLDETIYFLNENINIQKLKEACALLVGEHNFEGLCVKGSRDVNPIRSITHCSIEKTSFLPFESEIYYLKIEGTGFLKYMVRFIMGALLDISRGNLSNEVLQNSLKTGESFTPKKKAPAKGLHLMKISYDL